MTHQQIADDKTLQENQCIDDIDSLQALKRRESLYILDDLPLKKKPRRSAAECSPRTVLATITTSATDGSEKSVPPTTDSSTSVMRKNICQWMYKVVDFCDYDRKVTFLA